MSDLMTEVENELKENDKAEAKDLLKRCLVEQRKNEKQIKNHQEIINSIDDLQKEILEKYNSGELSGEDLPEYSNILYIRSHKL